MSDCENLKENFKTHLERKIDKDYLSEALAKYFKEFCLRDPPEKQDNTSMYNLADDDSDNDLFDEPKNDAPDIEF